MNKLFFSLMVAINFSWLIAESQTITQPKTHYIISENNSGMNDTELANYLNTVNFESYRFIGKRRTFKTDDGTVIILKSANELNSAYGRKINPLNLNDDVHEENIILLMNKSINKPVIQRAK